jgi:hypothetical protein
MRIATLLILGLVTAAFVGERVLDDEPARLKLRPTGSFRALSGGKAATVWAVGDSADGSAPAGRVARLIARASPTVCSISGMAWGNATDDGALRLRLQPGKASFAFVAADGRILRTGLVRCSG